MDNPLETGKPQPTSVSPSATQSASLYPVIRVVDGDTIRISLDTKEETVRLLGVDTPELVDPRKPVQCFAKAASEETKKLLNGMSVSLEIDPTQGERDKYGRLLAYVILPDGTNVSEYLIRNGFAHEYTYENNPHRYQVQFREAQKEARENKRGLWADGACP
jgi:micrococcal nuclease